MNNTLEIISSRTSEAEEWTSDLEDRMVDITAQDKIYKLEWKRWRKHKKPLRRKVKCTNICIIGVSEGEEREKEPEKIFEKIIAEDFPNMGKEIVNQVQGAQRVPGRINSRRNTPRYIVTKLTKIKDRDKILKATGEKWQITCKGTPIKLSADFSTETLQARGNGMIYFKWWKGRIYNQEYSTWQDSPSDLMEKSKAFQTSKS